MRWVEHVARIGDGGGLHTGLWWGHQRERDNLEDLGAEGRIILKFVFKECDWEAWTGLIWLRIEAIGGHL